MDRRVIRVVFPILVIGSGVFWCMRAQRAEPPPVSHAPSAPSSPHVALLDGLKPGDTIDDWIVQRLFFNEGPSREKQLAIELERRGVGMTVWIARRDQATNPPVTTEKYGLTNGHARPADAAITEEELARVTEKLAERVRRNEATAPSPL